MTNLDFLPTDPADGSPAARPPAAPRRLSTGAILLIAGVVAVIVAIGLGFLRSQQKQPDSGLAPDFTLTTFDGQTMRLSDLRGQVVVLNFWASWCPPCQREAPVLEAVWRQYRERGVTVLGVAYADTDADSRAFLAQYGVTYPNGPDIGTTITQDTYNVFQIPETFIINQAGEIVRFIPGEVSAAMLTETIDSLLETS